MTVSKKFLEGLDEVMQQEMSRGGSAHTPKTRDLNYYDNRRDRFSSAEATPNQGTFGKWENDDE
jgi:hypothetical protein